MDNKAIYKLEDTTDLSVCNKGHRRDTAYADYGLLTSAAEAEETDGSKWSEMVDIPNCQPPEVRNRWLSIDLRQLTLIAN